MYASVPAITSGGAGVWRSRQKRSNAEPRQPRAAVCSIHQDIRRLDVLMNETSLMHAAQRPRQTDRDVQKMRYLQRSAQQQSIERRSAGILEHQRPAAVIVRQRDRPERPVSIKFGLERVFVFKPLGRGPFRGNVSNRIRRSPILAVAAWQNGQLLSADLDWLRGDHRSR
jgi:hypothetical protein